MENGAFIITIDGPAGSGKTTTARILAKRLGFDLLESGAFYRFVTYFLLKNSSEVSVSDFLLLSENKQRIILQNVFKHLEVKLNPEGTILYLNGKPLKDELREPEVEEWVSRVSALPVVREMVNEYLRSLVKGRKLEKGICYYCGRKVPREELTMDHKIPLALGGTSSRENIVPSCKECNTKKKTLPPWEWEEYLAKLKGKKGEEGFEGGNSEG